MVPGELSDIGGTVFTTAAHALDQRLNALADTVCERDPRNREPRGRVRGEAMVAGAVRMACRCDTPDCPVGGLTMGPVVINVIADRATVDGRGDNEGSLIGADGLLPAGGRRRTGPHRENAATPPRAGAEPRSGGRQGTRSQSGDAPAEAPRRSCLSVRERRTGVRRRSATVLKPCTAGHLAC